MPARDASAEPALAWASVRHARLRPVRHAFSYAVPFLWLPMRRLRERPHPALRRNRAGWLSFHDRDHGAGGPDALAWVEALLAREGLRDVDGEIWLQTFPRVLGYAFKPVSFWFAHDAAGRLRAVLAEVHSTFGERHHYLLAGDGLGWGRTMRADKAMHVSPFCRPDGIYHFRFMHRPAGTAAHPAAARLVARVELHDAQGLLLSTSVGGALQPLSAATVRAAVRRFPLAALGITARIHWQALRLWWRGVPWFAQRPVPPDGVTHARAAVPSAAAAVPLATAMPADARAAAAVSPRNPPQTWP